MHSIQGGTAASFYRDLVGHIRTIPEADWLKDDYGKYTKLNEDHVCVIFWNLNDVIWQGRFYEPDNKIHSGEWTGSSTPSQPTIRRPS